MSNIATSQTNPKRPNMCKLSNQTCRDTNQEGNRPWLLSTTNNDANACIILSTWSEKGHLRVNTYESTPTLYSFHSQYSPMLNSNR